MTRICTNACNAWCSLGGRWEMKAAGKGNDLPRRLPVAAAVFDALGRCSPPRALLQSSLYRISVLIGSDHDAALRQ